MRQLTITVETWPSVDADPYNGWQADIAIDGGIVIELTGPGGPLDVLHQAVAALNEWAEDDSWMS